MKRVGIAELKSHLSENLAEVRRGETIEVLDRKTPVALITPLRTNSEPLQIRRARGHTNVGLIPVPRASRIKADVVDLLLEERAKG